MHSVTGDPNAFCCHNMQINTKGFLDIKVAYRKTVVGERLRSGLIEHSGSSNRFHLPGVWVDFVFIVYPPPFEGVDIETSFLVW